MPVIMEEDEIEQQQQQQQGHDVLPLGFQQLIDETTVAPATTMSVGGTAAPTTTTTDIPIDPALAGDSIDFTLGGIPCPLHPNENGCACHSFVDDWNLAEQPAVVPPADLQEPDYSKFENWIPQYQWPEKPCDYCRSRKLMCYIQRGEPFCTPCSSLFRECSLTNSNTLEATNYADEPVGTFLDTLHYVCEDVAMEHGTFTGIKPLKSKGRSSGIMSAAAHLDDAPGSSKRNGIRFPRPAVKILRDWLDSHPNHPYPTEEEKSRLEAETDLTPTQIANWLANARRRRKALSKGVCRTRGMSPSPQATSSAIAIPPRMEKPWDEMNPLERWKHSPPENEPATIGAITNAIANSSYLGDGAPGSAGTGTVPTTSKASSQGSTSFSRFRARSTGSHDTASAQTSSLSTSSAAFSHGSSHSRSTHGSFASFSSSLAGKKDRQRRRRRPAAIASAANQTLKRNADDWKSRPFQCTFCTDTFKSKYDWTRHEKSLHLSLEKWICAPQGPVVQDPTTGQPRCAYCDEADPSAAHLETHNHRQCAEKGVDARTFFRKDHLRQHLRLLHGLGCSAAGSPKSSSAADDSTTATTTATKSLPLPPAMDTWRATIVSVNSRCGFCAQRFSTWQERVDHLTAHFKAGARMRDWKGCRGLDPAVAAQVTNAMPPYLIGMESISPNPFSASNRSTWRQASNPVERPVEGGSGGARSGSGASATGGVGEVGGDGDVGEGLWHRLAEMADGDLDMTRDPHDVESRGRSRPDAAAPAMTTCWEVLTIRLGAYAKRMVAAGVVMTDEMLQAQARRIVYDSDDSWNQTPADNAEWLDLFKKASALDFVPTEIGGQGARVPTDLETYNDLGLRIPFAIKLEAYSHRLGDATQAVVRDEQPPASAAATTATTTTTNGSPNTSDPIARTRAVRLLTLQDSPNASTITSTAPSSCAAASAAAARARGLAILNTTDIPLPVDQPLVSALPSAKRPYVPRYRYQLSRDRARQFATVTGAWPDAGAMPAVVDTAAAAMEMGVGAGWEEADGEVDDVAPPLLMRADQGALGLGLEGMGLMEGVQGWDDAGVDQQQQQDPEVAAAAGQADFEREFDEFLHATTDAVLPNAEMEFGNPATTGAALASGFEGFGSIVGTSAGGNAMALSAAMPTAMDGMEINFDEITFDGVFDLPMVEGEDDAGFMM